MKKLLPKQKKFVETLFNDSGISYQVDAYIKVYGLKNSSRRTHTANASRLLNQEHVQAYYQKVRSEWFNQMRAEREARWERERKATIARVLSRVMR